MDNDTEKRMLLFLVLSVLIYLLYGYYSTKNLPPPKPAPEVKNAPQAPARIEVPETPPAEAPATQGEKIDVVIESSLYRAVLSNVGGVIKSWKLKKYRSDDGKDDFEMVPQYLPADEGYLFRLDTGDERLNREVNLAVYKIKSDTTVASDAPRVAPTDITLSYRRPGLSVEKNFHFNQGNYLVDVGSKVVVNGAEKQTKIVLGPSIGDSPPRKDDPKLLPQAMLTVNGKVTRLTPDKAGNGQRFTNIRGFAGVETHYFADAFLPNEDKEVFVKKYYWKERPPDKQPVGDLVQTELVLENAPVPVYIGPKEYDALNKINPALTGLIDYGTFAFIVKAFLFILKGLYNFVHNYGVAIIILTLIITLALFPLRYKQMRSMKRMQQIQPRIKAIQDKYKNLKVDARQKQEMMQREILELHQQYGINPLETLGGCLLLLPQLPIFYAFYNLLNYSIELRKAPFAFWIHDLSNKDPYYITPILMGVTMLAQYKLTPSTTGTDPAQQTQAKIMGLVFPIFLTFMFLNLSSGLNLYFLFSNLFGIALQKLTERWVPEKDSLEPRRVNSAAKRK